MLLTNRAEIFAKKLHSAIYWLPFIFYRGIIGGIVRIAIAYGPIHDKI